MIISIDPGQFNSAYSIYDHKTRTINSCGILSNKKTLNLLKSNSNCDLLVVENIRSYGNVIGNTTLDTCVWIGRFVQVWKGEYKLLPRKTIAFKMCHTITASDTNIRQAVISRFAEFNGLPDNKRSMIGNKKKPGMLYGVTKDMWAALAVALVYHDIDDDLTRRYNELLT